LNWSLTRAAICLSRRARSSGTMPPGFKAVASFSGDAAKRASGLVPIDLVSDVQPLSQAASEAGYPQCHQTRKR